MRKPKVSIVGTGKMAYNFGIALHKAGFTIVSIHGRDAEEGMALERKIDSYFFPDYQMPIDTEVVFLAVSDKAIKRIANRIEDFEGLVVHFSGHTALNFSNFEDRGIFWPVFSMGDKSLASWEGIPVCIDATSFEEIAVLKFMAKSIGAEIHILDQLQKKKAHLAAVFANNFSSHMVNVALQLLEDNKLPKTLLSAILRQTGGAIMKGEAIEQTGPAARKDRRVVTEQANILKSDQALQRTYKAVSNSIEKYVTRELQEHTKTN